MSQFSLSRLPENLVHDSTINLEGNSSIIRLSGDSWFIKEILENSNVKNTCQIFQVLHKLISVIDYDYRMQLVVIKLATAD